MPNGYLLMEAIDCYMVEMSIQDYSEFKIAVGYLVGSSLTWHFGSAAAMAGNNLEMGA